MSTVGQSPLGGKNRHVKSGCTITWVPTAPQHAVAVEKPSVVLVNSDLLWQQIQTKQNKTAKITHRDRKTKSH